MKTVKDGIKSHYIVHKHQYGTITKLYGTLHFDDFVQQRVTERWGQGTRRNLGGCDSGDVKFTVNLHARGEITVVMESTRESRCSWVLTFAGNKLVYINNLGLSTLEETFGPLIKYSHKNAYGTKTVHYHPEFGYPYEICIF